MKPKSEQCVKGICEAITEFCKKQSKKQNCESIKDLSDVEGLVMMCFRKNGKCRIHIVRNLPIEKVYEASKALLRWG